MGSPGLTGSVMLLGVLELPAAAEESHCRCHGTNALVHEEAGLFVQFGSPQSEAEDRQTGHVPNPRDGSQQGRLKSGSLFPVFAFESRRTAWKINATAYAPGRRINNSDQAT
jgi:hypothetical protein